MNFSFFKKMTAFILLPVFIVLIVMTYFSYGKSEKTLSETIDSQLTSIVKIQSEAIYSNMLIYRALTEDLSKDDAITHFAEAYLDNNQEKLAYYKPIATERLKRLIDGFSGINQVVMLNTQGIAILDTLQKVNGRDFSKEEFVLGALNGAEGHKATATSSKKIDFVICYPLRGTDGTAVTGYIFTVINLDHIAKRTIDNINFSAGGTALVLDTHGTVIMHKDRNLVGENRADMQVFQQINRVKNGIMRYEEQGKSRVVYVYDLKWLNWYLAFPVWEDSLLAGVHELHDNSLVICGVSLVILLAIIVVFAKRISSALGGIDNIARKVSGGDMHLTDQENGLLQKLAGRRDEIGSLSDSFAKMIATLLHSVEEAKNAYKTGMNEAAEKLQGVVSATSSVTHELSAQIQESSNGADIQAQRISETVTSVEEMNATIFEVTKNTVTTAQIAGNTRERAEEGQSVVKELMQSIAKVEQSTNTLKYDMDELNKHVQDINKIMAVISDLADQTNLLALNAAIEAARAGEAGRGFAVVADEVRKLAEKTMASTSNVGNAVIAIKNSTSSSLEQVGVTVDLVTKAIELADQCRAALTEIVDMASDSAERIGSIAVASEEQSSASEEITKSISDINGVVVQTSTTMNEAKVAIIELSKQADILANMVHSMRS